MTTPQKEKVELLLDSDVFEALKARAVEEHSSVGELIEKILGVIHLPEENSSSENIDKEI
ncbi:MAG: hypothetical protein ACI4P3_05950 [Candidatus Spyradosoma sp.]